MNPVRIGVIGCGGIAQIQHLPSLALLQDLFELVAVCDLSPGLAQYVAQRFHVPEHTTDPRVLLESDDLDAVLLCPADPKADMVVAAFQAGKHALIEKPVCYSLQEAEAIESAAAAAGTVGMAAYMKVYDPAFELAQREVATAGDILFVQINHMHPENSLHLSQFELKRFNDVPPEAGRPQHEARERALREALGDVDAVAERVFFVIANSMIHDLYGLRVMVGSPTAVVSTEVWQEGRALTAVLELANGARCAATWIDLPDLWDFRETLEVYTADKRVLVSYPTGFARGIPSELTVQEIAPDGTHGKRRPAIDWECPFTRELRHFHACIAQGEACRTPVADVRHDVALTIEMTKAYCEATGRRPLPA